MQLLCIESMIASSELQSQPWLERIASQANSKRGAGLRQASASNQNSHWRSDFEQLKHTTPQSYFLQSLFRYIVNVADNTRLSVITKIEFRAPATNGRQATASSDWRIQLPMFSNLENKEVNGTIQIDTTREREVSHYKLAIKIVTCFAPSVIILQHVCKILSKLGNDLITARGMQIFLDGELLSITVESTINGNRGRTDLHKRTWVPNLDMRDRSGFQVITHPLAYEQHEMQTIFASGMGTLLIKS